MSTERKMIGLPAHAHFVPPVPIDYGTRGTPSLVVKTIKGTNHFKRVECGQDKPSPMCIKQSAHKPKTAFEI